MDTSVDGMAIVEDLDPKRTAIVVGPFLGLLAAPVVFELMKVVDQDHTLKSDLIASVVATILSIAFMMLINAYLQHSCHIAKRNQDLKAYHQRSVIQKIFSFFSRESPPPGATDQSNSSFSFLRSDRSFSGDLDDHHRRKIDPKYFTPKYIINELMTFWGTTCTVITWGSFYVIGGTIVATERIAQKIKAKRNTSRDNSFNMSFGEPTNRGTGQSDSFMNMSFRSNNNDDDESTGAARRRHPFRRISSWTKRSYTSIKRRFSRVVTDNTPHFSSLTSPLNSSNTSFRARTNRS